MFTERMQRQRQERQLNRVLNKLQRFQERYQRVISGHRIDTVLVRMSWEEIQTLARLTERAMRSRVDE